MRTRKNIKKVKKKYNKTNLDNNKCSIASGSRQECGPANATELQCYGAGCCWEENPLYPSCYQSESMKI